MRAERAPAFPEIGTRPVVSVRLPTPTRAAYRFRGIVGGLRLRLRRRRGPPSCGYQPRAADHGVLYRVIDEHLEPFLDAAAHHADGHRLPKFVEQEFRDFLTCGVLAHGFARLRCGDCAFERLVPFSCKGRGFCPSCGGRRMTECAARLVDGILPHVPVRQWVLSLPHRLRYLLAWATSSVAPCSRSTRASCCRSSDDAHVAEAFAAATPAP
jgi:hypothetical protein